MLELAREIEPPTTSQINMPYEITWKSKGVFVHCSGPFGIKELEKANGLLQGDPRFDSIIYQTWNLLTADMSSINEVDMLAPAATDRVAGGSHRKMKVSFVVNDAHAVRLCEVYRDNIKQFGSQWDCRIFKVMNEALQWTDHH